MLKKIIERLFITQQSIDLTKERLREINELNHSLAHFNVRFSDLIDLSQNIVIYRQLFQLGKMLADDTNLISNLISTKTLPIQQLSESVNLTSDTIESNLNYIITIAFIHYGPYPILQQYFRSNS